MAGTPSACPDGLRRTLTPVRSIFRSYRRARSHARAPRAGGPQARINVNPSSVVDGGGCRNFPGLYSYPRQTGKGVEGRSGKTATPLVGPPVRGGMCVCELRILSARVSGLLVELESQVRPCVRLSLTRSEAQLTYRSRRVQIQAS